MTRTRMDVWNRTTAEGDWPEVLVAYEQAVGRLRALDPPAGAPSNPRGWRFLAAIHGLATSSGTADTSNPLWSNCQHGSWYFLPWHRMYLLAFELIVQDVLDDDTWSLPYWYAVDPDDPNKAVLPPAFRDPTPGNNLRTERRSVLANSGRPLPDLSASVIQALDADDFSSEEGVATFGGGERSRPDFNGREVGLLEGVPHGAVHSLVGNDFDAQGNPIRFGWMGSFFTAGLDPVFWLHHANIDRLWQVWLDHDPSHLNPTDDPAWFDTDFSFPAAGGGLVTWKIGEVLDTVALGYEYESAAAPSGVAPPAVPVTAGGPDIGLAGGDMTPPPPPEVLGATTDVSLASTEPVDVELAEPAGLGLGASPGEAVEGRVYLRIEGITGTAAAPVYDVYVNVPPGEPPADHPELRAGSLSTFGVMEASQADDVHGGEGLTAAFEITSVRDALAEQGRWDPSRVQLSFAPVAPSAPEDVALLSELEESESLEPTPADLHASRVAVIAT